LCAKTRELTRLAAAQNVLDYLKTKDISATFFVVGSRCLERPNVLIEEYMAGHEISVHTWSHKVRIGALSLQIDAEIATI
jgi:peptidoglycan/xylan/chitin deacetylase (PgdA/CDA1 family)